MISENERRRPDRFDEANSVPIALADGQQWYFPKPWLQIHASFHGQRSAATYPTLTYNPELDRLIQAISECEDNEAILCGVASLGAYLLGTQYDLTDAELDQLFAFRPGDPSSWDWAKLVMDVATGQSGARSFRGGDGSP